MAADDRERYRAALDEAAPGARWVCVQGDGSLRCEGAVVGPDDVHPEVAWLSVQIFHGPERGAFASLLAQRPSLRWVHTASAGIDGEPFDGLLARGVRLTTSHVNAIPIAEFVMRSVLDHYQEPQRWQADRAIRRWHRRDFREVHATTWVVIGYGAIGSAVGRLALGHGAQVVGVRRSPAGTEGASRMIRPAELATVLPDADVVVLALPAMPSGRALVDAAFLRRMRPGSVLVNVARGSLVDDDALLRALAAGAPAHAVLDVFGTEPLPPDSPWWVHPQVAFSPHNAAGGAGRVARGAQLFAANLARYRRGEPLPDEVPGARRPPGRST